MIRLYILIISFLIVGCEPSFRLYIKNSTIRKVDLDLILKDYEHLDITDTLYAIFEKGLIHKIKWSTAKKFNQSEKIDRVNDTTFHIGLCKNSTYMVSSGIIIPFQKIIVNQEHRIDTIMMYGKNKNANKIWNK